jgi:hypothetical protein
VKLGFMLASTAAAIGLVVAGLALLWIGGEMRYRNCLLKADLRFPVAYQQPTDSFNPNLGRFGGPRPHFVIPNAEARLSALGECSRWP